MIGLLYLDVVIFEGFRMYFLVLFGLFCVVLDGGDMVDGYFLLVGLVYFVVEGKSIKYNNIRLLFIYI